MVTATGLASVGLLVRILSSNHVRRPCLLLVKNSLAFTPSVEGAFYFGGLRALVWKVLRKKSETRFLKEIYQKSLCLCFFVLPTAAIDLHRSSDFAQRSPKRGLRLRQRRGGLARRVERCRLRKRERQHRTSSIRGHCRGQSKLGVGLAHRRSPKRALAIVGVFFARALRLNFSNISFALASVGRASVRLLPTDGFPPGLASALH